MKKITNIIICLIAIFVATNEISAQSTLNSTIIENNGKYDNRKVNLVAFSYLHKNSIPQVPSTPSTEFTKKPVETEDKKDASYGKYNRLLFLNAYAFDFNKENVTNSNYVGHLNILFPELNEFKVGKKEVYWGINAGIMKVNYLKNDASLNQPSFNVEYVYPSPFVDSFKVGETILRENNQYTQKISNTNWSFYFQPMLQIYDKENIQIYLNGHAEMLVSKWTIENIITNKKRDSVVITQILKDTKPIARYLNTTTNTFNSSLITGYFGAGLTIFAKPWKDGLFCIQYTTGKTTDNYRLQNTNPNIAADRPRYLSAGYSKQLIPDNSKWSNFYLVRSYYSHEIASKSKLYIGTDIRGFSPVGSQPKYAVFAGLEIDMDAIKELFKPAN